MTDQRVYIACLAAYNNGQLHGKWVEVISEDQLEEAIQNVIETSPAQGAEEWAIHDYEGFPNYRKLGENPDLSELVETAEFLQEHEDLGAALLAEYDLDEAKDMMENKFIGEYRDLEEWAEEALSDSGELNSIPSNLRYYFDFEAYARDARMGGDINTLELPSGNVAVFLA